MGAVIIFGIFLYILAYLPFPGSAPDPRPGNVVQEEALRRAFPDFYRARIQFHQLHAHLPQLILGLLTAAMGIMLLLHLRTIPRAVELTDHGVRLDRWIGRSDFIPYEAIVAVYQRPTSRHLSGAVCIRKTGFWGRTFCIARYAYPDADTLYRQLQVRTGLS